jgi:predicted amidohydrolase YtcJ
MCLQSQLTCTDMQDNVAAFEEDLKGSIQPGRLADLVVLAQDPFKTDSSGLLKIQVERTMVGETGNMSPDGGKNTRIHTSHA